MAGCRGRSARQPIDHVQVNSVVVSSLGSPYRLTRNPLAPSFCSSSSDPDWCLLDKALYPFALPQKDRIYDHLCTRLLRTQYSKNKTSFTSVKWFPDARRLMVTALSGELSVWSGETFSLEDIKRLPASSGGLTVSEWLPDGSIALIGDWGGNVHVTSDTLSPVALLTELVGHPIISLSASPTSFKCAAVGMDAYPMIWDVRSQTMERSLSALGYDTTCLQWHPHKGLIATGSKSDQLAFWDPRTAHLVKVLMAHKGSLTALQFSLCGRFLATSGRDACLRIWDMRKLECLRDFHATDDGDTRVTQLKWHPVYTSHLLVSGDSSGHVRCFDLTQPLVATGSRHYPAPLLSSLADAHEQHVTGVDFHPLGHVLSSVGAEGKLKLWAPELENSLSVCQQSPLTQRS